MHYSALFPVDRQQSLASSIGASGVGSPSTSSMSLGSIGPSASLEIVNRVISPDGFSRLAVLAGGTFPGPLIRGIKGDRFAINVTDNLTDRSMLTSTSIHWHGIHQHGTSHADGAAFVTECPISPGHSYLYQFHVPHLSTQYCDGLRGAFVNIDDETTILTLADWYHAPALMIPKPNSTLINGLGRVVLQPLSKLAVVSVVQGKRYRFRLISISCDPTFVFSIDGHELTIIEVDGINHQPLTVDSIEIFPGMRYSFVLHARHAICNYWIRSPDVKATGGKDAFVNATNGAILRYAGAPERDPLTRRGVSARPLVETALHPLVPNPVPGAHVPGGADVNLHFEITRNMTTLKWFMNGVRFIPPTVPVLLQILSGARKAQDLLPQGSVYSLPRNKVVEISIPGGLKGSPHTFHLHGHTFHVVRSAGNATYNWDDPVVRDVVSMGASVDDLTTFRFTTDNAGPWLLHCHVDWHLEDGIAVVLAEDIPELAHDRPPPEWEELCPTYEASIGRDT
ncbi:laccase [Mycena crocata]|nr:laccase [Mycena crocata]